MTGAAGGGGGGFDVGVCCASHIVALSPAGLFCTDPPVPMANATAGPTIIASAEVDILRMAMLL